MRGKALAARIAYALTFSSLAGCSSSTPPAPDAGPTVDAAAPDGGPIANCTTFDDESAASAARAITWDATIVTSPKRCMKVKVGQEVKWTGDFTKFPLEPLPGNPSNPIVDGVGTAVGVSFNTAGVFGYTCKTNSAMQGAIEADK